MPIMSERLLWDRKVLREKDTLLEAANQRFRDRALFSTVTKNLRPEYP